MSGCGVYIRHAREGMECNQAWWNLTRGGCCCCCCASILHSQHVPRGCAAAHSARFPSIMSSALNVPQSPKRRSRTASTKGLRKKAAQNEVWSFLSHPFPTYLSMVHQVLVLDSLEYVLCPWASAFSGYG